MDNKTIYAIAISIVLVVNVTQIVGHFTRKPIEYVQTEAVIQALEKKELHERLVKEAILCKEAGGLPEFSDNQTWTDCDRNK